MLYQLHRTLVSRSTNHLLNKGNNHFMNTTRQRSALFSPLSTQLFNALAVVILLFAFLSYFAYIKNAPLTEVDDAYMFVRYANNVLEGNGIAWNQDGIQTYGATSILYLCCIVLLRWLFHGMENATVLMRASALFGLLTIVVNALAINNFMRAKTLMQFKLPLAMSMAYLLLSPIYRYHAVSGMDTTISVFANSILAWASFRLTVRGDLRSILLTALAGCFSFLARPDNLLYAVFLPVCCQLLLSDRDQRKTSARYLIVFGAMLLIDSFVKWMIFGDPLPLSFYAKASGYYQGYVGAYQWNPVTYLIYFSSLVLPFVIPILIFIRKESLKIVAAFMIPIALTFIYFFSVVQIMGMEARYYVPALPFIVICSFLVVDHFLAQQSEKRFALQLLDRSVHFRLLTVVGLILLLTQSAFRNSAGDVYERLFLLRKGVDDHVAEYETKSGQMPPELGWWESIQAVSSLTSRLPEGTRVVMSEYGYIGAESPQIYIIDPLGLNDPVFSQQGFSASEFFNREPDLIWFPHPDYTAIVSAILDANEFWARYDYYPGLFDYGIAIRKDSRQYAMIYEVVENVSKESYGYPSIDPFLAQPVSPK